MDKYSWLLIATVMFGFMLIVIRLYLGRKIKITRENSKTSRRIGTVENLKFTFKMMPKKKITLFTVHELNGRVFYAGVKGHDRKLSEGKTIEIWPMKETIFEDQVPFVIVDNQGRQKPTRTKIAFRRLAGYRVLSKQSDQESEEKSSNVIQLFRRR